MRDLETNTMVRKSALEGYRQKIIRFKRNQQINHDNKRKKIPIQIILTIFSFNSHSEIMDGFHMIQQTFDI